MSKPDFMTPERPHEHDADRDDAGGRLSKRRLADLIEQLHAAPPEFEDESLAPEVDREVLVALVRREFSRDEAQLVYRLIYSFKSWSEAHSEVLIEEFRNRPR